jgi:hypothetical protein
MVAHALDLSLAIVAHALNAVRAGHAARIYHPLVISAVHAARGGCSARGARAKPARYFVLAGGGGKLVGRAAKMIDGSE